MSDEGLILFDSASQDNYDNMDVFDLESPSEDAVEFSIMSGDAVALAQDARPFNQNLNIPVRLDLPASGTYIFTVTEGQNIPFGSCLYIEDLISGESMRLTPGASMTIYTDAPYTGNRLMIHGSAPVATVITEPSCFGGADGSIDITAPNGSWSISLTGESDTYEYVSGGSVTFDHLAAGTYQLGSKQYFSEWLWQALSTTFVIGQNLSVVTINRSPTIPLFRLQRMATDGRIEWGVEGTNWFAYDIVDSQNQH
jgi:hypothetical protein